MGRKKRQWKKLARTLERSTEHWYNLAEQRGSMVARLMVGIEALIAPHNQALANELRQMAFGDLLPPMTIIYESDDNPDISGDENATQESGKHPDDD